MLDRKPERERSSKWFVTEEEFGGSAYPLYCGGWAYVTTVPTLSAVLAWSYSLPYLWIDDLHVTGVIPASKGGVALYDWGYNFLNHHHHYRYSRGGFLYLYVHTILFALGRNYLREVSSPLS